MENGAPGGETVDERGSLRSAISTRTCDVCGAATSSLSVCTVCGAVLGASHPTGSRQPEDPTTKLTVPSPRASLENERDNERETAKPSTPDPAVATERRPQATVDFIVEKVPELTLEPISAPPAPPPPRTSTDAAPMDESAGSSIPTPVAPADPATTVSPSTPDDTAARSTGGAFTPAGLPARVPRQHLDDDSLLQAFRQSWESPSDERLTADPALVRPTPYVAPTTADDSRIRTPRLDELLRSTALVRGAATTAEPPAPPAPPSPPEPAQPPAPPSPPTPPEPPAPRPEPGPSPVPPAPVPPAPVPPAPVPPAPVPPTPGPPIPPVPPAPVPPPPFPAPPAPVPPPPAMAGPTPLGLVTPSADPTRTLRVGPDPSASPAAASPAATPSPAPTSTPSGPIVQPAGALSPPTYYPPGYAGPRDTPPLAATDSAPPAPPIDPPTAPTLPGLSTPGLSTPGLSTPGTQPAGVYRGGRYDTPDAEPTISALEHLTAPIPASSMRAGHRAGGTVYGGQTGLPTTANADAPIDASGSLTGMILARGQSAQVHRKKERRAKLRTALFVALGAIIFIAAIAATVAVLAGDFIRSLVNTLV